MSNPEEKLKKELKKGLKEVNNNKSCLSCLCKFLTSKTFKDKKYYINQWQDYLTNETKIKEEMNDPFTILTNLWAHKNVITLLENVRINPNLIKKEKDKGWDNIVIRNDLEFYIPQICLFLLFGRIDLTEELLAFLCRACYYSYNFAHKVIWFLKSILSKENIDDDSNKRILNLIHIIQTTYKNDNENLKKIITNYVIPGSNAYIDYKEFIENYIEANNQINKDINVKIFTKYGYCTNSEDNICNNDILKQLDNEDMNLTSFLSNIYFFDHLTNLCESIKEIETQEKRQSQLIKEIKKINEHLPYNVYIPFVNKEIRNYLIGHISIKDSKVFKTKERAPILLTFECFRLEELCFEKKEQIIQIINKSEDVSSDNPKSKRKSSIDSKIQEHFDKITYLMGIDIYLSKPIIISKVIKKKKINKLNEINNEPLKYSNEPGSRVENEYDKINKAMKIDKNKIISNFLNGSKNKYKPLLNEGITDEYIHRINISPSKKEEISKIFEEDYIKKEKNTILDKHWRTTLKSNGEFNLEYSESESSSCEDNGYNNTSESYILGTHDNLIGNKDKDKYNHNQKNQKISFNITKNKENFSKVFGESLSEQEKRLKFQSEYGHLNSFKICKIIIKCGEDLIQEQFASQLINEFAQIFKIENVECFLYPYEIIATGINCGMIEVCPNSISIDELKHKTSNINPNTSLKNFYENYFGKGSKKYEKAIKNFIRSLAGYSLACYFLQIKDRHNGNILINNEGYLIQIDFGFFLSNAPGGEFEKAPFKLTDEVIEVLGGINSKNFQSFRKLMWKGMIAISKHYQKIMILVEMMYCGYGKKLECFKGGEETLSKLKLRFKPKENMKKIEYLALVDSLIEQSLSSWRTKWYDKYQYIFEGIFY